MAMQAGPLRIALPAAEESAGLDTRLAGIETRVSMLTWMVGGNIGLTVLALGAVVTISTKLGDISGQIARLSCLAH